MFPDKHLRVGVIGLGIIGTRVAECLRDADAHVYVWSRTPKTVPNFLSSPQEIAQLADVIQIFVTNGEALLEVLNDMKDRITKKHVIVNNSTVDLESTLKAAEIVESMEGTFLDAPFTGSKVAAEKGSLVYYVSGDPKALDQVRPVLNVSAKEILFMGEIGTATILKVATNMISATIVEVLCESYALTRACGVDPEKLQTAIEHNACSSALTTMKLPAIISQDYEAHFSLKNMFKDAQFALKLANDKHLDLPALSATASMMFKSIQRGYGEMDFSSLAKTYQDKLDASSKEKEKGSKSASSGKKDSKKD